MKKILLALILLATPLQAVTRYISPSGSDAGTPCTASQTIGTPAKTFAVAIACMAAGDTLILRDGTYSIAAGTGLVRIVSKVGTALLPYTLIAENERQAYILGSNASDGEPFRIGASSYWTIQGLRIENGDFPLQTIGSELGSTIDAVTIDHVEFKRNLVQKNNRYKNCHPFGVVNATFCLFEENEIYEFHRHGLRLNASSNNVVRRNYAHGRSYADIGGGYGPTDPTTTADGCFTIYPGSNNIVENNIAEGCGNGFDLEALGTTVGNKFYGNMAVGCRSGLKFDARGSTVGTMPQNSVIKDLVVSASTSYGIYLRGNKNTTLDQVTILGSTANGGFAADVGSSEPGDGLPTFFATNINASGNTGTGFFVTAQSNWLLTYPNSFGNTTAFNPSAADSHITFETTVNPNLGSCKAWLPSNAGIKATGNTGLDQGANILYQYQNGILTSVPLWDTGTNNFTGCGVVVAGVNDVTGTSCTNVDIRLSIGTANGCDYPAGYGTAGSSGGTWLATDNFDSYTLGNTLNGGAGGSGWGANNWTEGTAAVTVSTAPGGTGSQGGGAFFVNADPNFSYSRAFSNITAGIASWLFRLNTATPADAIFFFLTETGTAKGIISVDPDSNVKIFDGTSRTNIGTYLADTWHKITVEFDDAAQPNAFRAKLDAGVFSAWQPAANGGTYTNINGLKITPEGTTLFASQLYVDDIREGSTSSLVSTIALVDAGIAGTTMFVAQTRALQWSSTDLTGNIDLLVSRDAGLSFQMIAPNVPNTGTYNWTVTGPSSTQCIVKVRSSSNPLIFDDSATFSISGTRLTVR